MVCSWIAKYPALDLKRCMFFDPVYDVLLAPQPVGRVYQCHAQEPELDPPEPTNRGGHAHHIPFPGGIHQEIGEFVHVFVHGIVGGSFRGADQQPEITLSSIGRVPIEGLSDIIDEAETNQDDGKRQPAEAHKSSGLAGIHSNPAEEWFGCVIETECLNVFRVSLTFSTGLQCQGIRMLISILRRRQRPRRIRGTGGLQNPAGK